MKNVAVCEFRTKLRKKALPTKTKIYNHRGNFIWRGIKTERYKSLNGTWKDVLRRLLIGQSGEKTGFHLRYFEVAPSGYTTLERHRHTHVIIGIRERGLCIVGRKRYEIGFLDILYICPNAVHQLKNPYKKPFGFFCIVNSKRDKPRVIMK